MGADLYGSFYFRDSYNDGSLLWAFGLSWWKDVTPLCSSFGELRGGAALQLLGMMKMRSRDYAVARQSADVATKKHWTSQYRLLSRLLRACDRSGEPILCSL